MKEINRQNRFGLDYTISEVDSHEVLVKCEQGEMRFDASFEQMNQGWYRWMVQGNMIQDAFPFLSSGEREFLMTGITPKEWDKIFKLNESEEY
jgi:hypothetical protein